MAVLRRHHLRPDAHPRHPAHGPARARPVVGVVPHHRRSRPRADGLPAGRRRRHRRRCVPGRLGRLPAVVGPRGPGPLDHPLRLRHPARRRPLPRDRAVLMVAAASPSCCSTGWPTSSDPTGGSPAAGTGRALAGGRRRGAGGGGRGRRGAGGPTPPGVDEPPIVDWRNERHRQRPDAHQPPRRPPHPPGRHLDHRAVHRAGRCSRLLADRLARPLRRHPVAALGQHRPVAAGPAPTTGAGAHRRPPRPAVHDPELQSFWLPAADQAVDFRTVRRAARALRQRDLHVHRREPHLGGPHLRGAVGGRRPHARAAPRRRPGRPPRSPTPASCPTGSAPSPSGWPGR